MLNFNSSSAKLSSQPVPGRILSWVLHDTRGWRGCGGLPCVGTSEPLVDSLSWAGECRQVAWSQIGVFSPETVISGTWV